MFWSAIEEVFPKTKQQRCWVHKTTNVLDKMPKSVQVNAKKAIHEIYMSPTKEDGMAAFEAFLKTYRDKYPKLRLSCDSLAAYQDNKFRHRTKKTKGCGSVNATLTMVFKLAITGEKKWRKLKGCKMIEKVLKEVIFKDGEEVLKKGKNSLRIQNTTFDNISEIAYSHFYIPAPRIVLTV